MAFKPLGYYCNNTIPFIEGIEAEYGSYLQKMGYELKLAIRVVLSSLVLLQERSNQDLTVRQLAQQACGWVLPYIMPRRMGIIQSCFSLWVLPISGKFS